MAERLCDMAGCETVHYGLGYCQMHYKRAKRLGEPGIASRLTESHGLRKHPLYNVWRSMRHRCGNPANTRYNRYGGRGIRVCAVWDASFVAFYTWAVRNGYAQGLQLDRIDNDGNYSPENCRWATGTENARNRSTTVLFTAFGATKTLGEWAEDQRCDIPYGLLRQRVRRDGIPLEEAMTRARAS